jgi:histidine kinase-, DNA gyrase B-, and HSP90-like ATPase
MFITEEIIRSIFKKERYYNVESKYNFLLFVIPIGSLYLCINILNTNDISLDNILSIFILLSINLSVFYILSLIIKSYERIYKQDMIKSEYKYYKNQLELIQDSNNKTAKIRHDYKNHMIALKNYINNGKQKEIDVYIDSVLDNLKPSNIIIDSGNFVIDSLLNYKIGCIDNLNYKIDVKVPKRIFVSDYDINILLGNLLDNAINALENDHEKILNISIIYKYESLYIKFCNSYSGYYKKKGNSFITTKDDKLNHGYGLKNIEEIVHKYSGNIEYYTDNNKFIVDIILCQNN